MQLISYVESYVESSVELRCKRRFDYVKGRPVGPVFYRPTGIVP